MKRANSKTKYKQVQKQIKLIALQIDNVKPHKGKQIILLIFNYRDRTLVRYILGAKRIAKKYCTLLNRLVVECSMDVVF